MGSSECSVLGQAPHCRRQLSITHKGRGLYPLAILHRAHCKSPIKPALQMSPRLLELHDQRDCGSTSNVLFTPHYVGRMYQLSTEHWEGWEDRAVMRGRKPFHSRAGLGINEHPAQFPHPPASACTPPMIQNHLFVGLWCPYWHECN